MRIALEEGYNSAAVARVEEGVALRKDGFTCPVFTLGLPLPEEAETAVKYDLIVPVDDTVELEPFEEAAESQGKILEVWLPIDTGMNRIGTHPEDVEGFLEKLKKYPHIHIHGTFTHMAKADIHDKTTARKQLEKFEEALSHMPQRLEKGFIISAGVSDAPHQPYYPCAGSPQRRGDWLRRDICSGRRYENSNNPDRVCGWIPQGSFQ